MHALVKPFYRGVIVFVLAVLAMSLQDALVKAFNAALPLGQLFTLRAITAAPFLLLMCCSNADVNLWSRATELWPNVRAWLLVIMYLCVYIALFKVDLSTVAAAFYTGPIFIVVFSVCIGIERPTRHQKLGVISGFAGLLLILRPGISTFDIFVLLPVVGAMAYAAAALIARHKCQHTSGKDMAFTLNNALCLSGLVISAPFVTSYLSDIPLLVVQPWQSLSAELVSLIAALAILFIVIGIGLAYAHKTVSPSYLAPLDYLYLPFAILWSIVFFGQFPDTFTITGILLIVSGGVLSARGSVIAMTFRR